MYSNDNQYFIPPKSREKKQEKTSPFSPTFHFNEFKVGSLENASTINIGNNYPSNFKGFKRHNQGLGTIDGNNNDIHDLQSHLHLRSLIDAITDSNEDIPVQVKEMIKHLLDKELEHFQGDEDNDNAF